MLSFLWSETSSLFWGLDKETVSGESVRAEKTLEVVSEVPDALLCVAVLICVSEGVTLAELLPGSSWIFLVTSLH